MQGKRNRETVSEHCVVRPLHTMRYRSDSNIGLIAGLFDGLFHEPTNELIQIERYYKNPIDDIAKMTMKEHYTKDWSNSPTESQLKVIDSTMPLSIAYYLDEYNKYYEIVQDFERVVSSDISTARAFLSKKHDEEELAMTLGTKDMYPTYLGFAMILDVDFKRWGVVTLELVSEYIRTQDSQTLFGCEKDKYFDLLEFIGFKRLRLFPNHPPLPPTTGVEKKWDNKKTTQHMLHFHPKPTFDMIWALENGFVEYNPSHTCFENVNAEHINDISEYLGRKDTLVLNATHKGAFRKFSHLLRPGPKVTNVIFHFTSNGDYDTYMEMPHILDPRLTQFEALVNFTIPYSKLKNKDFRIMTHIKQYQN